jgi:hypothetical protein
MVLMCVDRQRGRIAFVRAGHYFKTFERTDVHAILAAAADCLLNLRPWALLRLEKQVPLSCRICYARYRANNSAGSAVNAPAWFYHVQLFRASVNA